MKRITTFLLVFSLVLLLLPSASAADTKSGFVSYAVEGGNIYFNPDTGMIVRGDVTITSINIPDEINGVPVVKIDSFAFNECSLLKEVILPDSLREIGNYAFQGCHQIRKLDLGNGLQKIGMWVFRNLVYLTELELPDSLQEIGENAFQGCAIRNLRIPGSVQIMGACCFGNCEQLQTLYIEDNVPYIGNYAFCNCFELKEIRFPETPFSIRSAGFSHCGMEEIILPEGLSSLGHSAFLGCHNLQRIGFKGDKPFINSRVFAECTDFDCDLEPQKDRVFYYVAGTAGWSSFYGDEVLTTWNGINFPGHPVPTIWGWSDVFVTDWYAPAVEYAVAHGLMNGIGNGIFAPQKDVTRAMVVTILWRAAGSPQEGTNSFADIPEGQWYTQAVSWAAENGVVNGMGNHRFDPDGLITREQLVTMIYRFAILYGVDTSPRTNLEGFPDAKSVSSYAQEPVCWAVATGLINGVKDHGVTTIQPQGNASRAQICAILQRYLEQQ